MNNLVLSSKTRSVFNFLKNSDPQIRKLLKDAGGIEMEGGIDLLVSAPVSPNRSRSPSPARSRSPSPQSPSNKANK